MEIVGKNQKDRRSQFCSALAGTLTLAMVLGVGDRSSAQLTPDTSLGSEASSLTENLVIRGLPGDRVDGGAQRGPNLFHSFWQFNVAAGRGVYFSNPAGVNNILTRVTGNNPSQILGRLGVLGNANLFLLNPNGIVFGPNASLDVAGSFVASTASALALGESGQFSATTPDSSTLLAVEPGALFLNALTAGSGTITNQGNLTAGQDLTLVANRLELQGQLRAGRDLTLQAADTIQLRDSATAPFIAQAGRNLLTQGNQSLDIAILNHPDSRLISGGDMVLRSGNPVIGDAHYSSGGNLRIEQLDGSPGSLISPNDPIFQVEGDFSLLDYSGGSLQILAGGSVTILGDVEVDTAAASFIDTTITLSDGTVVDVDGTNRPVLDIRAGTTAFFGIPTPGVATSADIRIDGLITVGTSGNPGITLLTNQDLPDSTLSGNITLGQAILAYGPVYLDSKGSITTGPSTGRFGGIDTGTASGTAGEIRLLAEGAIDTTAGYLSSIIGLVDGSGNVTLQNGTAGDITLVSRAGTITTAGLYSSVAGGTSGSINLEAAGDVRTGQIRSLVGNITGTIETGQVSLGGSGNAGDINIFSTNGLIDTTGGPIFSQSINGLGGNVTLDAAGDITAGNIIATSNNAAGGFSVLTLTSATGSITLNGSSLNASNLNPDGLAGDIFLDAATAVNILEGSSVASQGRFGRIFIGDSSDLGTVTIDRSFLDSTNRGSGNGGVIDITAGTISINSASLTTASSGQANGGRITLTTARGGAIDLSGSAVIDASISGTGSSGIGVTITAPEGRVSLDSNSQITTATTGTATSAAAGAIQITANQVSLSNTASLNATTAGAAPGGDIIIDTGNGAVTLENSSLINTAVQAGGSAAGGDITISTGSFSLLRGARVQTRTFDQGTAGDIQLNFSTTATIAGFDPDSLLYSGMVTAADPADPTDAFSVGGSGSITINAVDSPQGELFITDGAFLSARNGSSEAGGNIAIHVNNLNVTGGGQILTTSSSFGDAGAISVTAIGNVTVAGGRSPLPSPTSPFNNPALPLYSLNGFSFFTVADPNVEESGNPDTSYVRVQRTPAATATIDVIDTTGSNSVGNGGTTDYYEFTITRDGSRGVFDIDNTLSNPASSVDTQIFLYDRVTGQLLASNDDFFPANRGSISSLDSRIAYNFNSAGTYVLAVTRYLATAESGQLPTPVTGSGLASGDPYLLQVSLQNQGSGSFNVSDRNFNQGLNSGLFSNVQPPANVRVTPGSGLGGNITVTSQSGQISLADRASINASTAGLGQGGNVLLQASSGAVNVTTGARVETRTTGVGSVSEFGGNAGSITVNAPDILVSGSSSLGGQPLFSGLLASSDTAKSGQGGEIIINNTAGGAGVGQTLRIGDGAFLSTLNRSDLDGRGITINVANLELTGGGQVITAAEGLGQAGGITINADRVTLSGRNASFVTAPALPNGSGSLPWISGGQTLDLSQFAVNPIPQIDFSTTVPHAIIQGQGGAYDLYRLDNVTIGNRIVADIDNDPAGNARFDTELFLFDSSGRLLERNDDSRPEGSDRGSNEVFGEGNRDSYVDYTFTAPGTYYLGVGKFPSNPVPGLVQLDGTVPDPADRYTLHLSIDQRNSLNPNQSANSGLFAQSTAPGGAAGTINLNARQVSLQNDARISASTTSGQSGSIQLNNLETLQVQNSLISVSTENGTAGDILVNASQSVQLSGTLPDGSRAGLLAEATQGGSAGNLQIATSQLTIANGAQATVSSTGAGTAGALSINASSVTLSNNARLAAETQQGSGGDIQLQGLQTLQVQNSLISVSTENGTAGDILVNASQSVQLSGTLPNGSRGGLLAEATQGGSAGSMQINTAQLTIDTGAQATVSSTASGTAGALDITATSVTLSNNARLAAETQQGSGGDIQLQGLQTLQLTGNSQISASTIDGQGGTLSVAAARSINLSGNSSLLARATGNGSAVALSVTTGQLTLEQAEISTSTAGQGNAGKIAIQANALDLARGSRVTSLSSGTGNAGSITINLRDRLTASASTISAASERGGGGQIAITAQDIRLRRSSPVTSSVFDGAGGGGSISFSSNIFIALEDSDILANAVFGGGGRININAPVFIADIFANVGQNPGRDFSRFRGNGRVDISASSQFGVQGVVSVPDFTFLQNSLSSLASNFVNPDQVVAGSCLARRTTEQGSFTVTGVGGLPRTPYDAVSANYPIAQVRPLPGRGATVPASETGLSNSHLPAIGWQPGDPIQEAQGLITLPDGRIVVGTNPQLATIAQVEDLICHPASSSQQ